VRTLSSRSLRHFMPRLNISIDMGAEAELSWLAVSTMQTCKGRRGESKQLGRVAVVLELAGPFYRAGGAKPKPGSSPNPASAECGW
jgi:hypothetical protein